MWIPIVSLVMMIAPRLHGSAVVSAADLVGRWKYTYQNESTILEFDSEGTFSGKILKDSRVVWTFRGRWELHGRRLGYFHYPSPYVDAVGSAEDEDEIVSYKKNKLWLRDVGSGMLFPCIKVNDYK